MKQIFVCLLIFLLHTPGHTHNLADTMSTVLPSITYIKIQTLPSATSNPDEPAIPEHLLPSVTGTGFVIDKNNIVTNYHVIEYAAENPGAKIRIRFRDTFKWHVAKIVGYDKVADVALLKIDGEYPSLTIASGTNLRMGDPVFTISHFYAIGWSATQGVVSSPFRFDSRYPYIRELHLQILQGTGSSGGAVFDMNGHVIAINRSITPMMVLPYGLQSTGREASTIASGVRGDTLLESIEKIREQGVVKRIDLGAHLTDFGFDGEYHLNYNDPDHPVGVAVLYLEKDNTDSELEPFDVITQVNGARYTDPRLLLRWLDDNFEAGDTVNMQVYRGTTLLNIEVVLQLVGE